jgi:hypothetical protein
MSEARDLFFMLRLRDGRVLMGGAHTFGTGKSVDIFDPDTNTVTPPGPLNFGRGWLTAHALPDGRAIVIGGNGRDPNVQGYQPLDSIEIFDPKTNTFAVAPYKLNMRRFSHSSALVLDGTILVLGGYNTSTACTPPADTPTVERIDPASGKVDVFGPLLHNNTESNAVTLLDGSILNVGGGGCGTTLARAEMDFLAGSPVPR